MASRAKRLLGEHFTRAGVPKVRYQSKDEAEQMAKRYTQRSYHCKFCDGWHTASDKSMVQSREDRIKQQRNEIRELQRQLDEARAATPPDVRALERHVEKLRSDLTRSIHRGQTAEAEAERLRDALRETVDLCNAMRAHAPTLNLNAERRLRDSLALLGEAA